VGCEKSRYHGPLNIVRIVIFPQLRLTTWRWNVKNITLVFAAPVPISSIDPLGVRASRNCPQRPAVLFFRNPIRRCSGILCTRGDRLKWLPCVHRTSKPSLPRPGQKHTYRGAWRAAENCSPSCVLVAIRRDRKDVAGPARCARNGGSGWCYTGVTQDGDPSARGEGVAQKDYIEKT